MGDGDLSQSTPPALSLAFTSITSNCVNSHTLRCMNRGPAALVAAYACVFLGHLSLTTSIMESSHSFYIRSHTPDTVCLSIKRVQTHTHVRGVRVGVWANLCVCFISQRASPIALEKPHFGNNYVQAIVLKSAFVSVGHAIIVLKSALTFSCGTQVCVPTLCVMHFGFGTALSQTRSSTMATKRQVGGGAIFSQ